MKTNLVLNPHTGEFDTVTEGDGTSQKPRRSMKRGGEEGAYDFKFVDSEDVTVFCLYARKFAELKAQRDDILETVNELTKKANALDAMPAEERAKLSPDVQKKVTANLVDEMLAASKRQNELAASTVTVCVVGWENASIPYSPQNRDELPFEVCTEWFRKILEQSELSQTEADFLSPSSTPTSPDDV